MVVYDRRFVAMQMVFGTKADVGNGCFLTADNAERLRADSGGQCGQQMWTVSDDAFASNQVAVKRRAPGEVVPVTSR
jgi:hypothetical protein